MNCYATVDEFRAVVTTSKADSYVLWLLEGASREIEGADMAGRRFWTEVASRYYDGPLRDASVSATILGFPIDDCLAVTEMVEDVEGDWTYSQAWTQGTDFVLMPNVGWPKTWLQWLEGSELSIVPGTRRYKLTGTWGAGDCEGRSWAAVAATGTVATTSGTTLTLSVASAVKAGQTILVESEQMFVTAVSGTSATVERGVNGTTAAAHTAKAISVAVYPIEVGKAAVWLSAWAHNSLLHAGVASEGIGQYRVSYRDLDGEMKRRIVGRVRRH